MPVSLAEDLDAIAAFSVLDWGDREAIRQGYAATLVKRQSQRPTFDTLFDLYFPRLVGEGVAPTGSDRPGRTEPGADRRASRGRTVARLAPALAEGDDAGAAAARHRGGRPFGAMRGAGRGCPAGRRTRRCSGSRPQTLVDQVVAALLADGRVDDEARRTADRRIGSFAAARRGRRPAPDRCREGSRPRRAGGRPAEHRPARLHLRPQGRPRRDAARDLPAGAAARDPDGPRAPRPRRRGPLDFRRTVRASISTGGVPLTTHHKPKRPHRTELVVLCDVSGSVASFAQFTLMLVYALHEQFGKVRAFTFVDQVHEVTDVFRPGADLGDVMGGLAARTAAGSAWGRTNYGRAFATFADEYADALGPRSSLLILGDARSNYSDLGVDVLRSPAKSPPRVLAQPRAPAALGHRRLRRRPLRLRRPDGRVPQPRPALGLRARPPSAGATRAPTGGRSLHRVIWRTWLVAVAPRRGSRAAAGSPSCSRTDGSVDASDRGRSVDVVAHVVVAATEVSWSSNCTVTCSRLSGLS